MPKGTRVFGVLFGTLQLKQCKPIGRKAQSPEDWDRGLSPARRMRCLVAVCSLRGKPNPGSCSLEAERLGLNAPLAPVAFPLSDASVFFWGGKRPLGLPGPMSWQLIPAQRAPAKGLLGTQAAAPPNSQVLLERQESQAAQGEGTCLLGIPAWANASPGSSSHSAESKPVSRTISPAQQR